MKIRLVTKLLLRYPILELQQLYFVIVSPIGIPKLELGDELKLRLGTKKSLR
jgi:hypothetical protein